MLDARFHKSNYKSKAGLLAKMKCSNVKLKKCKCVVQVLISSVTSTGKETLDERFITNYSGELHSKRYFEIISIKFHYLTFSLFHLNLL